jgi:hypothetical protein
MTLDEIKQKTNCGSLEPVPNSILNKTENRKKTDDPVVSLKMIKPRTTFKRSKKSIN